MIDFRSKALLSIYGVICSPWMLLRVARDPFDDKSEAAHGRLLLKRICTTATADKVSRSDRSADQLTKLTHVCNLRIFAAIVEEVGHVYASCEIMHAYKLYTPVPRRIRRSHLGSCSRSKHCSPTADAFFCGTYYRCCRV